MRQLLQPDDLGFAEDFEGKELLLRCRGGADQPHARKGSLIMVSRGQGRYFEMQLRERNSETVVNIPVPIVRIFSKSEM